MDSNILTCFYLIMIQKVGNQYFKIHLPIIITFIYVTLNPWKYGLGTNNFPFETIKECICYVFVRTFGT